MRRAALEHLLRAAAAITGEQRFYVVGSAAIVPVLDEVASAPDALTRSREADLIPASNATSSIDLIDGALGLDSIFDGTFGYHADGIEFATVIYGPRDWQKRTVFFSTPATQGAIGLCMERHDLAISKLCAGRSKDFEFVRGLVEANLLDAEVLRQRLDEVTGPAQILEAAARHLAALFRSP